MSAFFSDEAQLALIGDEDVLGHLFHSNGCQPVHNGIYPPTQMHHMQQRSLSGPAPTISYYPQPHHGGQTMPLAYSQQPFWATSQPTGEAGQVSLPPFTPPSGSIHGQFGSPSPSMTPGQSIQTRASRSPSSSSNGGYPQHSSKDSSLVAASRAISPSAADLRQYGYMNKNGTWTCGFPGCTSRAVFTRGCDLRKHHKRHTKSFFCHHEGCPQATGGGFSSKKDLARHEAKHNPGVICEWKGCDRVFSRVDNMRDHVKRIHLKGPRPAAIKRTTAA